MRHAEAATAALDASRARPAPLHAMSNAPLSTAADRHAHAEVSTAAPWWLPLRRALGHVRRSVECDTFDVFARRVEPEHATFRAPSGYRFDWGSAADVEACDEFHTELDARERAHGVARLALGHRVVIAWARGADGREIAVFSMWINPRHLNVPEHVKRKLRADQVFIYKAFTSPEHRGRKLYESGMRFVLADMAARGQTELVGYAHVKKAVSRKGLAALGFASLGRFRRWKTPLFTRCFESRELVRRFPEASARSGALERGAANDQREPRA